MNPKATYRRQALKHQAGRDWNKFGPKSNHLPFAQPCIRLTARRIEGFFVHRNLALHNNGVAAEEDDEIVVRRILI